ncbi:MAG TPA: hypothetical protein ENF75_01790 [Acidilobales archaeon]|nr:hypothetical protein [Acidilobales archaeon]
MNIKEIIRKVNVLSNGAIVLGSNVVIDSHYNRRVRVVTHTHSDHMIGLRSSIALCRNIVATPLTIEIINELGYRVPKNRKTPLPYGTELKLENSVLKLIKARHIMGSAQVILDDHELGLRITYTGDFKHPGSDTPVVETDILIIESTYGRPEWVRPFKYEIENLMVDFVSRLLREGPVHIRGFHGKIQEVMEILRGSGIDAPFILPDKIFKITKLTVKHGMNIGNFLRLNDPEAKSLIDYGWYIFLDHAGTQPTLRRYKLRKDAVEIILTGWEFKKPIRKLRGGKYVIAFSDHADFEELISYVENAQPKFVITDASRSNAAYVLASEIKRRLGIEAIALPARGKSLVFY